MRHRILFAGLLCGAFVAPIVAWQSTATSDLVLEITARRYPRRHVQVQPMITALAPSKDSSMRHPADLAPAITRNYRSDRWMAFQRPRARTTRGATGEQLAVRISGSAC
jgi:hypothetical protein